ncbi:hypothetical protein AKJ18_08870 [Vibrio xuii]|nr:hypothetical protein AKJ18_08870 [Vibrio xuii]
MLITTTDIYHSDELLDLLNRNEKRLNLRRTRFPQGQTVLRQGEQIEDILFVLQGSVSLYRTSEGGRRYQLGCYKHNGFLGLMELFSAKPCFYSVELESECQAYVMSGAAFHQLVCHDPELASHTFKHLTSKWYLSVERMTRNILHSITYCVVDDLLNFAQHYPGQDYIANKNLECERLGTSLRVYNRILKQLSERGAIRVHRKHIEIMAIEILKQIKDEELEK